MSTARLAALTAAVLGLAPAAAAAAPRLVGPPVPVGPVGTVSDVRVATNAAGDAAAAWIRGGHVEVATRRAGAPFGAVQDVADDAQSTGAPSVQVGPDGTVTVVHLNRVDPTEPGTTCDGVGAAEDLDCTLRVHRGPAGGTIAPVALGGAAVPNVRRLDTAVLADGTVGIGLISDTAAPFPLAEIIAISPLGAPSRFLVNSSGAASGSRHGPVRIASAGTRFALLWGEQREGPGDARVQRALFTPLPNGATISGPITVETLSAASAGGSTVTRVAITEVDATPRADGALPVAFTTEVRRTTPLSVTATAVVRRILQGAALDTSSRDELATANGVATGGPIPRVSDPRVRAEPSGLTTVTWLAHDGVTTDVRERSTAPGSTARSLVDGTGLTGQPGPAFPVALSGGGLLVPFTVGATAVARTIDVGVPSAPATISTTVEAPPQAAADGDGSALIGLTLAAGGARQAAVAVHDGGDPVLRDLAVPVTAPTGAGAQLSVTPFDAWSPVEVTWEFGDGSVAQGATVTHAYAAAGTFTVTVRARDAAGNTATATRAITVADPPPAAVAPAPPAPDAGIPPAPIAGGAASPAARLTLLGLPRRAVSLRAAKRQVRFRARSTVAGRARFELRRGRTVVAARTLTLRAGQTRTVTLTVPRRTSPGSLRLRAVLTPTGGRAIPAVARTVRIVR